MRAVNTSSNVCVQVIEFDDGSGSVLRIQPLRSHRDEAVYECTATNSVGEINTSAKLTVLEGETSHQGSGFKCPEDTLIDSVECDSQRRSLLVMHQSKSSA